MDKCVFGHEMNLQLNPATICRGRFIVATADLSAPIRINLRTDEYPWCIFCRRKTMKKKPYLFVDEILHKVNLSPNEFRKGLCLILSMLLFSVFLSFSKLNHS